MKSLKIAASIGSLCLAVACGTAQASLIWTGDPTQGLGVFKNINIQDSSDVYQGNPSPNGSSASATTDGSEGNVFKFDKAVNDRRCEAHGANGFNPAIGSTYYIGWRFKLTSTVDDNAVFQWKSYGSPMVQNFPLVIKMISGKLTLQYYPPNGGSAVALWSQSVSANTYYTMTLRITVSDQTSGGSVSFWFNEAQQTLSNGSTSYTGKTFDGNAVDPKWGIYGATSTHVIDYVSHLKIGTTFADVDPGGGSGGNFSGIYQIQNEASGLVLNNQGSLTNGSPITQWTSTTSSNLDWQFIATSGGYYQINSCKSAKDAVVQGASTAAGAGIVQWSFGSSGDDQWKPQQNSDGSYTFFNLHSGLVLGDPAGSTSTSTQMDQEASNGGTNQKWKLLKQ